MSQFDVIRQINQEDGGMILCQCGHFLWWHTCKSPISGFDYACCAMKCDCMVFRPKNKLLNS